MLLTSVNIDSTSIDSTCFNTVETRLEKGGIQKGCFNIAVQQNRTMLKKMLTPFARIFSLVPWNQTFESVVWTMYRVFKKALASRQV